jgi:hypothetical protein
MDHNRMMATKIYSKYLKFAVAFAKWRNPQWHKLTALNLKSLNYCPSPFLAWEQWTNEQLTYLQTLLFTAIGNLYLGLGLPIVTTLNPIYSYW